MRIVTRIVTLAMILFLGLGAACAQAEDIAYVDAGDKELKLNGDFSLRAVVQRTKAMNSSIRLYDDGKGTCYDFVIRWLKADNCEVYLEKHVKGEYMGYVVAEELESLNKTTFSTTYFGWDVSQDSEMEVILTVQEGFACVSLKGVTTGNSQGLHFDLSKSAMLNGKATEKKPSQLTKGQMPRTIRGGSFTFFGVDENTKKGKKAMLPRDPWLVQREENSTASTPFGELNVGDFTAMHYKYEDIKLPYQIYLPEGYEEGKEYPVMLFMHGRDMWGTDNKKQIASEEFLHCRRIIQEKRDCIILAPQSGYYWVLYDAIRENRPYPRRLDDLGNMETTVYMDATLALLNEMKEKNFVDASRVYMSGYSMGAHACFYLAETYPDDFAAAIIYCGIGRIENAEKMAKTPMYVYHGVMDTLIDYESTKTLMEAVENAGGDVIFKTCISYGHGLFNPMRSDKEVIDWLFSKSKEQPEQ